MPIPEAAGMTRRERYEQKQRLKSLLIAAASTVCVVAAVIISCPNDARLGKGSKKFF